jgi:hypothetical protein
MKSPFESHGMTITPLVRIYYGNRLVCETVLNEGVDTEVEGAVWRNSIALSPVGESGDTFDLEVSFNVALGHATSAGVAVAFNFDEWFPGDYLLLPGAVYQGNDFEVADMPYPPLWRDEALFREDMPVTITPAPRLAADSLRIEQTTGDTSSPCMGFHSSKQGIGFLVQATQGSRFGNHGLTVERGNDGKGIRFLVTAPCVREFRQDHCRAVPSDDLAADWREGDSLTLRFRVSLFQAAELQSLFDRYAAIRKSLNPSTPRQELPFSAAWAFLEEKYNRDNWVEVHGYYKMAPNPHTTFEIAEDPLCFLWQLGWVGGGMMTVPMLAEGDALTRQRAWRNLEMIFEKTQAASGFFHSLGDGEKFYSDGFDRPSPHRLHMVRKSGDWLYFSLKHFDLFRKQQREFPTVWEQSIRRLADAFVRLFDTYAQFGQFVDVETGKLLIGGSSSGAIVSGALARAAAWFGEPEYLRVAEASARDYYQNHIRKGLTTGGPGEILSAPDSESVFALLESFVALLEETGDPFYAMAARETAAQAATWVVAYDHQFPADSSLAKAGVHSTGAVFANIQNKHGAPGICTFSGDSLFRLWRATGDELALDLIRDIAHGMPQYVSREDKPLSPAMQSGWMCERVNLSDWEKADGVGGCLFGSCSWVETSMMLTTWEIPGLYVQPDTGRFIVFDHVIAKPVTHANIRVCLEILNPTRFDAQVRVLCELSSACAKPLDSNPLFGGGVLSLAAGESATVEFSTSGWSRVVRADERTGEESFGVQGAAESDRRAHEMPMI